MRDILCWRDQRYVGKQLTFSYNRQRIMLDATDISRALVGKYVDTYEFPDGGFQIRWKQHLLPHTIFDMHQRVTHAAITSNKRLGAVLAHIKNNQETQLPPSQNLLANNALGISQLAKSQAAEQSLPRERERQTWWQQRP